MQGGLVRRKLPVCPSAKRVDCVRTEERSVEIFIPYGVFWEKERLVQDDHFYLKFWLKSSILYRYSLVGP